MNSLKRRRKRKDRYERLSNESLEKRLAFNAGPVLDTSASPELDSIAEDLGFPSGQVGTPVSSLIDTGGTHNNFFDADGDSPGIAITGVNLEGGSLRGTQQTMGALGLMLVQCLMKHQKFLSATTGNRVYYQPAADFTGAVEDVMSFKAWDGSTSTWNQLGSVIKGQYDSNSFGADVSLSADGQTLAIGASGNGANGVNSGTVSIFK